MNAQFLKHLLCLATAVLCNLSVAKAQFCTVNITNLEITTPYYCEEGPGATIETSIFNFGTCSATPSFELYRKIQGLPIELLQTNSTGIFSGLSPDDYRVMVKSGVSFDSEDITIQQEADNIAPVAVCRQNYEITLFTGTLVFNNLEELLDGGSSDNCSIVSMEVSDNAFSCSDVGNTQVITLTVTDAAGNSDNCNSTVRVVDAQAPTALCNQGIVVQANGMLETSPLNFVNTIDNGSFDNCGFTLSLSKSSFSCLDAGIVPVELTVTDDSGNSSSCTSQVTVVENGNPNALCRDLTIQLDDNGTASISASDIDNGSSDACTSVSLALNKTSFTCADLGPQTVMLTAIDVSGNTDNCSAVVTVEDHIAPMAQCQGTTADQQQLSTGGSSQGFSMIGQSFKAGQTALLTAVRVYLASDVMEGSTISPTIEIRNGDGPDGTLLSSVENIPLPTDVSSLIRQWYSISFTQGASLVAGNQYSIVIKTNSSLGNNNPATILLTKRLSSNPYPDGGLFLSSDLFQTSDIPFETFVFTPITINLDATGNASISTTDINNGSTDNCGIANLSLDLSDFDCTDVGSHVVQLTAVDISGNTASCSTTVIIEDQTPPTVLCQDLTIPLNTNGPTSITISDIDNGSFDACTTVTLSLNKMNFTCADVGSQTVMLTATDLYGNSANCSAVVTIEAPTTAKDIWIGCVDSDWDNPLNWLDNSVPTLSDRIEIPETSIAPHIMDGTTAFAREIAVLSNGHLSLENGSILHIENGFSSAGGINNLGTLLNQGVIHINNMPGSAGVWNDQGATFTNMGTLNIGQDGANINEDGIYNRGNFINHGVIHIDNVGLEAIFHDQGSFTNSATINIGQNGGNNTIGHGGIGNSSTFNNTGTINIDNTGKRGIVNYQTTFTNNGIINLGQNINDHSIWNLNQATFINAACAEIYLSNDLRNEVGCSFANDGFLSVNTAESHTNAGTFTNNGIIEYLQSSEIPGVINSEIIIAPTATTECEAISPAFSLGSSIDFEFLGVFPSPEANTTVGLYDPVTNTFTPLTENSIDGNYTYYVGIRDVNNDCTRFVKWELTLSDCCETLITCYVDSDGDNFGTGSGSDFCDTCPAGFAPNDTDCDDTDPTIYPGATELCDGLDNDCDGQDESTNFALTCPADISVNVDPGTCSAQIDGALTAPVEATDNCAVLSYEVIGNPFGQAGSYTLQGNGPVGTVDIFGGSAMVTYRLEDEEGNAINCSFQITVIDNELPTLTCPDDMAVMADPNFCEAVVEYEVLFSDACPLPNDQSFQSPTQLLGLPSGATFPLGTMENVFNFTDASGNTNSCSFSVTVIDSHAPMAECLGMNFELGIDEEIQIYTLGLVSATDNCSAPEDLIFSTETPILTLSSADAGSTLVDISVRDEAGNEGSCQAIVNIEVSSSGGNPGSCENDIVLPSAKCKDATISLDANGTASLLPEDVDAGSTDNCGIVFLQVTPNTFGSADLGDNIVELVVTDLSGHSSTCTANVVVSSNQAPSAICKDISVNVGEACSVTVNPADIDDGSFDPNGDPTTISLDITDPLSLGTHVLTLTVSDGILNDACTATVTVNDTEAPEITCMTDLVFPADPGTCSRVVDNVLFVADATDNCSNPSVVSDWPGTFPVGITTVNATATDAAGNAAHCSFTVTIDDKEAPEITCMTDLVFPADPGACSRVVDNVLFIANATDNCSNPNVVSDWPGTFPVGITTVNATASDAAGNTAHCSFTVEIEDTEAPVITCLDDMIVDADPETCERKIINVPPPAFATDNCSVVNISTDWTTIYPVGVTTVNATASDAAGNTAHCSFTVTVNDVDAPEITCMDDITVDADPGTCTKSIDILYPATATDECSDVSISSDWTGTYPLGVTTVHATATDAYGNTADCSFQVTVNDVEAPSAICQDITVDLSADGTVSISGSDIDGGSSDNCGILDLKTSPSNLSRENIGQNIVNLKVTDGSGNSSDCDATVTVNPVIIAYVWDDWDGDGKQDSGEPAIANAKVELIDFTSGSVLQQGSSNASGEVIFSVEDIAPTQKLKLKFFEKTDHRFTLKDQGNNDNIDSDASRSTGLTATFTLDADGLTDKWDCGLWSPGRLDALVWDDRDGDGKQDAGEPGIKGVKVHLLDSEDNILQTDNTNNAGIITFHNVPANRSVRLHFVTLPGFAFTLKDQGSNDNIDSDANRSTGLTATFKADKGQQIFSSWDAGMWSSGTIEAYVWDDLDGDGKQDDGEPSIANADVHLLESDDSFIASTVTNAAGIATFGAVPADRPVKLKFFEPTDHRFTLKDIGNNDNIDSDANRSSGITATFKAIQGAQLHEKMDCGLWSPGKITSFVWHDLDGDGKQDALELGLPGVDVDLLESNNDVIASTTTGTNGVATFLGVPADRALKLKFHAPEGLAFTLKDEGTNDNIDSDAKPSNGRTKTFQASMGEEVFTTWDAGFVAAGTTAASAGPDNNTLPDIQANTAIEKHLELTDIDFKVFPNPFSDQATIRFTLVEAQQVLLEVFNLQGQRVRVLDAGLLDIGMHERVWYGSSDDGQQLKPGMYIVRLQFGEEMLTRKVTLVR